jgi:8-oxo-dGTP pyrophosphatase MutT (NUDIX family)
MRGTAEALSLISAFTPSPEEDKSRELIAALLEQTPAPFSRRQFHPGHITCTALVLDPGRQRVLLVFHHKLHRWLLPGGHVEEEDGSLAHTAQREAEEETAVRIAAAGAPRFVGMDVHAIPANKRKKEPFHLHHDLIFAFTAESDVIRTSEEAPEVTWCALDDLGRYHAPTSIVRAAMRAANSHQQEP